LTKLQTDLWLYSSWDVRSYENYIQTMTCECFIRTERSKFK